ncbi:serine/threonine-protein kinase [Sphaerisporangium dianthi]|uniref:non-specific serine/threonine protein kinase n=1 Tax=Sphaerisporangium dianthi TaxID=1436120 RepID=A0ABV9CNA7_9ACTN
MAEPGAPEVPGYEVLGVLGQGGFGVVYRARQLAVRREVALKVDNRVLLSDRDRRRFMREVSSAGALSGHPHVADVYDAGVLGDGRPYMVLELCPGGSLADRLRAEGPLSPAEVRDIGVRIGDALAAAHAAGVLHRDVKPANILVNGYGMVALTDFGLAAAAHADGDMSVTRESLTPAFGPPEAFELAAPSPAGDVYSLAATLYALLSGRPPRFPEGGVVNIAMIMAMHRRPIPEIPGVPAELTAVLRAGMATDPRMRIPSAVALRDALSALPAALLPSRGAGSRPARPGPSLPHPASTGRGSSPSSGQGPSSHAAPFSPGTPGSPGPGGRGGNAGPGAGPGVPVHGGHADLTGPGRAAEATGPGGRFEATGPGRGTGSGGAGGWAGGGPAGGNGVGGRGGVRAETTGPGGAGGPGGRGPGVPGPGGAGGSIGPRGSGPGGSGPGGSGPGGSGRVSGAGGRVQASGSRGRADPASTVPPPAARPHGQTGLYVAVAGVFALLLTTGAAIMVWEGRDPGTTTTAPSDPGRAASAPASAPAASPATSTAASPAAVPGGVFGPVATTTASCPAAAVIGAKAACGQKAECWGGMVVITGDVSINRRGCEATHTWETFAIAPLPADGITSDMQELEAHPVVKRLCSPQVLLRSRYGAARRVPAGRWLVSVLPPSPEAFKAGVRVYRCVGGVLGAERPGTYFRPLG